MAIRPKAQGAWGLVDETDEKDALADISRMLTGSQMLQNEPGVVYSLAAQKANPADAGAIDQFMQALDAEKQVKLARATGEYLNLTPQQQQLLDADGTDYQDVLYTSKSAAQTATQHIMDSSNGALTPKLNADGSLQLDAEGNIQVQKVHHSDGGWFGSVSGFFSHLGGAIKSGAEGTLHGLQKGYNFVQAGLMGEYADKLPGHQVFDATDNVAHADATRQQDMIDQGYDPNSIWSTFAFGASGRAHSDLSSLNDKYGTDKVDEALKFLSDPKAYREQIEQDPNSFATDAKGQTTLTPEAQAKLAYLNSDEFVSLAKRVNAHQNTVGNALANDLGIDPIKHATTYNLTAAGANIAASFAIDPTLFALKGVQVAKLSQVGINTLGDSDKAAEILTRTSKLPWVNNVQRGWQRAIDLGAQMREAHAASDDVQLAKLTAQFNAELPGLAPLMPEFVGHNALTGWREVVENGVKTLEPVRGATGGIQSLDEAAAFIKSQQGLNLLRSGRAATQSSLMPGALSAFGYRKVKGAVAGFMTTRSATRAESAYRTVISKAEADPTLGNKLVDEGILTRLSAQADDAVAHDGTVLAQPVPTSGLASAARGEQYAITYAGKGEIARNLRATGDELGDASKLGLFSPTAIAARSRLAAQRLSTLLPRNTVLDINDADNSGDKLYKYALTYLNRGDAQALRASWNFGGSAERKAIIDGLIDQIGHAAGLPKSATGQALMNDARTDLENYSAAGQNINLDGQNLALFEGQTRKVWRLPSFQAVQQASSKVGLWEATMGRALTSKAADTLMGQWKIGALFKPSTVTRNQLEGWLNVILRGQVGDAVKARVLATARNKELWERGYGLEGRDAFTTARNEADRVRALLKQGGLTRAQRTEYSAQVAEQERVMDSLKTQPAVQHLLAQESGDADLAKQIENGSMLAGPTTGRSVAGEKLANLAPLAWAGRAYRSLYFRDMNPEEADAIIGLGPAKLAEMLEGYGQQATATALGYDHAAREASEITKAGLGPSKVRYIHSRTKGSETEAVKGQRVRWTHQALDGTVGADRYANALAQRVNAMPATARAALAHIEDGSTDSFRAVIDALEQESKNTAFGKVFFEDPTSGTARRAVTDEEVEAGKYDFANKVVQEYKYLLTGQNGEYQRELANYIAEHGKAPDGNWIADHLTGDNRPISALAPEVMAMPSGGIPGLISALQDVEGAGYQWLVERPLQRTTSSPVMLANYGKERAALGNQIEQLVGQGFSREAADNLAEDLATRSAWVRTEQTIDDPGQKAQFDVIARNMFPFARATQAMIRRWGTGIWQNPANARKLMLAYEGAVHSGLIYNNIYGEPTFTYPGSGVMNMAMRGIAELPGMGSVASFPVASDMTGGVLMSVPGADNPFRMSMGPMMSIPLREVYKHLLPTAWQGEAMKLDSLVNGPIGTGETFTQLVPTAVRKFYVALAGDQRNSALASSMNGAFANLAAAGMIPPTDASPSELQLFRSRLQTQVRSQLFLRAVFGLFAPAAPSSPTEGTSASSADYAWQLDGIKQLSDEYKAILNEAGGDVGRANAIFTALHPDQVVYKTDGADTTKLPASAYETARSGPNAAGAYLPATDSALSWLTQNEGFVKRYQSVAAYFLPNQSTGEPFNDAAYQAQLELGLRLRKTPTEFMNDVYTKHAESLYYPAVAEWDRRINDAKASGDTDTAAQLTQEKSDWEKEYKAINPAFGAKQDDYGTARATALGQLADLRKMVADNDVPDGLSGQLSQLLTTYANYQAFVAQYPGQDAQSRLARSSALDTFNRWAQQALAGSALADVYNGVFRVLNTNLVKIDGGS